MGEHVTCDPASFPVDGTFLKIKEEVQKRLLSVVISRGMEKGGGGLTVGHIT